jgi:NAD(P)-dependent dehydrogenase (short-subunit alcohol dehydrogenase family)
VRDFSGKVAVVTGGGSPRGIGRATGRLLAERGCRVVLADLNEVTLKATVDELTAEGLDVTGIPTDVADYASMEALADSTFDEFGQVDIVFLNAGIGSGAKLFGDDLEQWHRVIGVNVYGVLHGIKAFVPRMVAQGTPGHVLATSSGAGVVGVEYQSASYAMTKSAVCTLLEALYGQLRDQDSLVRATVVLPGLTRSNLAGNPETMTFVQQGLQAAGVSATLTEPEQVAVTVIEAIEQDSFWAHHDNEADQRLYDGKFAGDIAWGERILRSRADALINRTAPDPYLWGMARTKAPAS